MNNADISQVSEREARVPLGRTGMRVSPLGVGAWAWGDTLVWGYGSGNCSDEDIRLILQRGQT